MNIMKKLFVLALLIIAPVLGYAESLLQAQDELLEPDKAFALKTKVPNDNTLEATWKVADGYYLYRDKFKFEVMEGDVVLEAPMMPAGKVKEDPSFGKVETYEHEITIQLPLKRKQAIAQTIELRITSQGCNEPVGVCYPPIVKRIKFDLPESKKAESIQENNSKVGSQPGQTESSIEQEFLHPDEAFKVSVTPDNSNAISVHFTIADGYYLYRDKIGFSILNAEGTSVDPAITIENTALPKGKIKDDPYFGKIEVYTESFAAKVILKGVDTGSAFVLKADYQGCADKGICYPPTSKNIKLTMPETGNGKTILEAEEKGNMSKFALAMLAAFVVGLGLSFTPCVLPMIPILSSIIVEESTDEITKLRGGLLASSYVLGTSVTYTIAGVLAGATGDQLQAYFQNAWAIGILTGIFVLLALSMFGFFHLQLPAFIHDRLHSHTQRMKGGSYVGVFVLGLVSALIIGACVSPLVISALSVAIASRDPMLGGAIMFSMSLGMGVILIALGVGAGFLLPKAGKWMDRVKHFFGVMLLAVAIYLLGTIPEVPVLLLWAALLIVTSMYFGATQYIPEGASGWRYFWKGIGMVMLIWGVMALIGGLSGNRDVMRPIHLSALGGLPSTTGEAMSSAGEHVSLFETVSTLAQLEQQLIAAKNNNRPVVLDFYADWCTDCVRMEKTTFNNPRVKKELMDNFVLLQVDVTDSFSPDARAIKKRFGVFGPPAMLFIDVQGNERTDLNFYGFKSPEEFLVVLKQAKTN